jgi:hypothetical protein
MKKPDPPGNRADRAKNGAPRNGVAAIDHAIRFIDEEGAGDRLAG